MLSGIGSKYLVNEFFTSYNDDDISLIRFFIVIFNKNKNSNSNHSFAFGSEGAKCHTWANKTFKLISGRRQKQLFLIEFKKYSCLPEIAEIAFLELELVSI